MELTDNEAKALKRLLQECARQEREDMIGLFMRHGLFKELSGTSDLVILVEKIEGYDSK